MAGASLKNQKKILKQVLANQAKLGTILANQRGIVRSQKTMLANQKKILTNQAAIMAK